MSTNPCKRATRSAASLKLNIETPLDFCPPHRSSEIKTVDDPFARSPRISRSPVRQQQQYTEEQVDQDNILSEEQAQGQEKNQASHPVVTTRARDRQNPCTIPRKPILALEPILEKTDQPPTPPPGDLIRRVNQKGEESPQEVNVRGKMANVTFAESLLGSKTPATPKFLCPSMFNPCSVNASAFLKQYERTSAANGWDNALKMAYFESFLEGAAELWLQRHKEDERNMTKTWEELKEDFLEEYGIQESKRALEKRLYDRKQSQNESVTSYFFDLQAIYMEYDRDGNAEDFRKYFESGLKQDLYTSYRLILDEDMDWKKFKTIIAKLDDISTTMAAKDIPSQGPTHQTAVETSPCTHCCPHGHYQHFNRQYPAQNSYRTTPNYFRNTYQDRWNRNEQHSNGAYNRIPRQPAQTYQNGYREGSTRAPGIVPKTRTSDGRPRCYNCNRIGHFAATCRQQNNGYPNTEGRCH